MKSLIHSIKLFFYKFFRIKKFKMKIVEYISNHMSEELQMVFDKPLFKTKITIKCFKNGKISGNIIESHNGTVLNGRTFIQEFIFGHIPNPENHLTLNTILGVNHSETVYREDNNDLDRFLTVDYFCIGNGAESKTSKSIIAERTSDTKLYNMVPFRCVPFGSDLSDEERKNYRLRKIITIKGEQYIAYYAKKISSKTLSITYNGQNYKPVESDTSDLPDTSPEKPLKTGKVIDRTSFIIKIDPVDFKEYYKAMNNGSLVNATLNEVGLIQSVDVQNTNENNKLELAAASLFSKMTYSNVPMDDDTNEAEFIYEMHT